MEKYIPLLLTSSIIAHDISVKLIHTEQRLQYALQSIEQWLRIDPKLPIVLCDGSNYNLGYIVKKKFRDANIECLHFENDQNLVRKYGRGFGEGEIVRHALANSHLIQEAGCFAKCSSKLWVKNFAECRQWWNGDFICKGVFLDVFSPFKPTVFQHVDTRFYIASKSFYERHYLVAHHGINVEAGYGLEERFYEILMKERIHHALLPVPPIIEGVGGGTASYYRNSVRRILKERLRLALARRQPEFIPLFADGGPVRTVAASFGTTP